MQFFPRLPKAILVLVILFASFQIVACQSDSESTPIDDAAIQATVEAQVAATVSVLAQNIQAADNPAPAATETPVEVPTETPTVTPTEVPTSTPTPVPTDTPTLVPTNTPLPTSTPTPNPFTHTTTRSANLRGGPGTNFAVIGSVQPEDAFAISARTQAGDWFEIETASGVSAWLASFLVERSIVMADIPVKTDLPTPPTASPQQASVATQPTGTRLQVDFINPHYNCDRGDNGLNDFYRFFQADFFITNTSSETIEAPWEPPPAGSSPAGQGLALMWKCISGSIGQRDSMISRTFFPENLRDGHLLPIVSNCTNGCRPWSGNTRGKPTVKISRTTP